MSSELNAKESCFPGKKSIRLNFCCDATGHCAIERTASQTRNSHNSEPQGPNAYITITIAAGPSC